MNIMARFFTLSQERVGVATFNYLWEMFPECRMDYVSKPTLALKMPLDDPRFEKVKKILQQCGLKPRNARFGKRNPDEYDFALERIYNPSDWEPLELLVPSPWEYFVDYNIDSEGRVCVEAEKSTNQPAIGEEIVGDALKPRLFVTSKLRADLEAEEFGHLQFHPVLLKNEADQLISWPDSVGAYWGVTTDLILPPANWANMFNAKGESYTGDRNGGCYIVEGLHSPGELHYHRDTLRNLPPFALALADEMFGPGRQSKRNMLVASKAFYRFCTSRNLKMDWIPVRIDD